MNKKIVVAVVAVVIFAAFVFVYFQQPSDAYSVRDGRIFYPANRPVPAYNATVLNETPEFSLTKIAYESRGATVYALLRAPRSKQNPPVVIILPGSTVTKEGRQPLAEMLQKRGYASLVLDERGNGETKPPAFSLNDQFAQFVRGEELEEAKMTLDALKAYDVLSAFPVDRDKAVLLGESMGGKYAVIAVALEPRFRGVILVSAAGYGLPTGSDFKQTAFFRLVDPDNYLASVAPRPVFFIHSPADGVVTSAAARKSFGFAREPKEFAEVACPSHGYCDAMDEKILGALEKLFQPV